MPTSDRIKKFFERGTTPWTTGDMSTGGLMPDDHLDAFVQMLRDNGGILADVRVETMKAEVKRLDRIDLPGDIMYSPDDGDANLAKPSTGRRSLTAKRASIAFDLDTETLEDSIESDNLEATLLAMIAKKYGNQAAKLGCQGDEASLDTFLALNDGWWKTSKGLVGGGGASRYDTTGKTDIPAILSELLGLVPTEFQEGLETEGWVFNVDPATERKFRDQMAARGTDGGDRFALERPEVKWQGIPLKRRGYFTSRQIMLTPPKNLVYGIRRRPKVQMFPNFRKDTVEVTVHGRIDYEVVAPELIVLGYDV